jgi:hypothetical protein
MSRLWSPAGDVPDRPPFGVWIGEPAPPPPRELPGQPPRWRRSMALLAVAGMLATAVVVGSVVAMVDRLNAASPPRPPALAAPTLESLNASIARGETFLNGLYKPLGVAGAVQSEHYGLPIRVRFPHYRSWVLLGQGPADGCRPASCPSLTRITTLDSSYASEAYELQYATPAKAEGLRLRVRADWGPGSDRYRITVTAAAFNDQATSAEVWLDDVRLGTFSPRPPNGVQPALSRTFPAGDVTHLRSFRYTVRHATQLAWLYAVNREDRRRESALARFMLKAGFVPGQDLRAAIFGSGRDAPRDFSYRHEPFLDAYGDCRLDPPATPMAYPYRSKACLADVQPYLLAARHDTLLPTIEALQALNRGESPDSSYRDQSALLPLATTSASKTADELERRFDQLGFGIPRCTPLGCDRERASALRTFTFGMLETVLGYRGGELSRRPYADAAAHLALSVQIGQDGVIRGADQVAYRPALRGGFLSYWNHDRHYLRPSGVTQAVVDRFNMPPEYLGLKPTDSETGFDAYSFLVLYRCARYQVGCQHTGVGVSP